MHPFLRLSNTLVLESYDVLLTLGIVAASLVALAALRRSLGWGKALVLIATMVWGALFGSHLAHCLVHWDSCRAFPTQILAFWKDGHMLFGALGFCGLLLLICPGFLGVDLWTPADAFALGAPLGLCFARIGCYLKGCCWGVPIAEGHPFYGLSFKLLHNRYTAVHPVQIYSAAADLSIFFLLLTIRKRQRISGTVLGAFGLLYGCARFLLEFYRGDTAGHSLLGFFTIHQEICLLLVPASAIFLLCRLRRQR
jgi:phosphatidylglycerol---prolipoprotein diacylglyceryl transferase